MLLTSVYILLLAQSAPSPQWVLPPTRVHYYVNEHLAPDQIRALKGPQTVLWLRVEGNVLKKSTVDTLRSFEDAWVVLSSSEARILAQQLRAAPRVGIDILLNPLDKLQNIEVYGPKRLAFELDFPLNERIVSQMVGLPVTSIDWTYRQPMSVLDVAYLRLIPGKKVLQAPSLMPFPVGECPRAEKQPEVYVRIDDKDIWALPRLGHACGYSLRVRLHGVPSLALLEAVFSRSQRAEFEVMSEDERQFQEALLIARRFAEWNTSSRR